MNATDYVDATILSLREVIAGMDGGIYQRKDKAKFHLYQKKDTGVLYPPPISDLGEFREVFFEYRRQPDRVEVNWVKSSCLNDEKEPIVRIIERIFTKAVRIHGEDECYTGELDVLSLSTIKRSNVSKIMKQVMATTRDFVRIEGFSVDSSCCSNANHRSDASPQESPQVMQNNHSDSERYFADTEGFDALNSSSASLAEGR